MCCFCLMMLRCNNRKKLQLHKYVLMCSCKLAASLRHRIGWLEWGHHSWAQHHFLAVLQDVINLSGFFFFFFFYCARFLCKWKMKGKTRQYGAIQTVAQCLKILNLHSHEGAGALKWITLEVLEVGNTTCSSGGQFLIIVMSHTGN